MNLKRVTKKSDLVLDGVDIQMEMHDASISSIAFTDKQGHMVKVFGDYGVKVCVPAPPKTATKYRLSGKFEGLVSVSEDFDDNYSAQSRLSEFQSKSLAADCGLVISEVEVPEED